MNLLKTLTGKKAAKDGVEFVICYSGHNLKDGWMDLDSLCTLLQGLSELTQKSAKVLQGERLKTQLMIGSITHKGDTFTVSLKLKEAAR